MKTRIDVAFAFGSRVAATLIGFAVGIISARLLGPEGRGVYSFALLVAGVYVLPLSNLAPSLTYQISSLREVPARALSVSLLLLSVIAVATIIPAVVLIPRYWETRWWFAVFIVAASPLTAFYAHVAGIFLGLDRVRSANRIGLQSAVLSAGCTVGALLLQRTAFAAVLGWAIGQCLSALLAGIQMREHWSRLSFDRTLRPQVGFTLRFGLQIALVNAVSMLNYRADVFLVERYSGYASLGIYSIAVALAETLWFFSSAISLSIYGRLGHLDHDEAAALAAKAVRHTILITAPAMLALFLAAPYVIPWLYGRDFAPAARAMQILLPGVAAYSLASALSAYFTNHLGRPRMPLLLASMSLVINVVMSVWLIPRMGMTGAALATTVSYGVTAAAALVLFFRSSGLRLDRVVPTMGDVAAYVETGRHLLRAR